METPYDPAPAARLLAEAWRSGSQLRELPAGCRPATLEQGYALQDRFMAEMGDALAGWKLGMGSPAAMRNAGLQRPLIGRLRQPRCFRSGQNVRLSQACPVTVEFEIAFVLARDVVPGHAPEQVLDAVASTHSAFELVQSRYVDRRAVGLPSFAGDSVGFDALVLGEEISETDIDRVIGSVRVAANGEERARGLSGDDLPHPLVSLRYLFEHARERGITLRQNEIVTAGAVALPFDADPRGVTLTASYAGGQIEAVLS